MSEGEIVLRIGGAGGQGMDSVGEIFAKMCSRNGLHVNAYRSYQSIIKGGHTWYQIRTSDQPVRSPGDAADLVIALNQETMDIHASRLNPGGGIMHDPVKVRFEAHHEAAGARSFPLPALEISKKYARKPIMANVVALGAACWLFQFDLDHLLGSLTWKFSRKGAEIVAQNHSAARDGYEHARASFTPFRKSLQMSATKRPLMMGNHGLALGAAAAGCKFFAQYPMTPATSIMHWVADNSARYGLVLKQAEDEIAAIHLAIGASFAGVRSMTATSGGGFALMVEAWGLAAITETSLVVVVAQRSGPSTGLPTKIEQGDLNMVFGAGQGDAPRVILAPRDHAETISCMAEAFNIADRWQVPVCVLSDLYLSESFATLDSEINLEPIIDRGEIRTEPMPAGEVFPRYAYTESGVSPRSIPGTPGLEFVADSDEHDETGQLVSDTLAGTDYGIETRIKMMQKRQRKLIGIAKELPGPVWYGPEDAAITIICWGSTSGAIQEGIDRFNASGEVKANSLSFYAIHPLPVAKVEDELAKVKRGVSIEMNFTGQFTRHLRAETGFKMAHFHGKYDGEHLTPAEVVRVLTGVTGGATARSAVEVPA